MNLNDFNRYAEDFVVEKKEKLVFLDQELARMRGQQDIGAFRARQQQMVVSSTTVPTLSTMAEGFGLNELGRMIHLKGINDE